MALKNHITQSNPRTGASSVEQKANNFKDSSGVDSGHMMDNDKLVY